MSIYADLAQSQHRCTVLKAFIDACKTLQAAGTLPYSMQLEGEIFTQHEAKVGADTNPSRYGCRSVRGVQVCGCGCINCHAITASVSIADWCCMLILLHTVCACTPAIADARLSKATHVLCVTISDHLAASWVRHISIFYLLISFPSCTIARRKSWQPHSPALLSLSLSLSLSFARSLSLTLVRTIALSRALSPSPSPSLALSPAVAIVTTVR